jgi:hypothetical protein
MKFFVLTSIVFLVSTLSAHAQGGVIVLSSDPSGANCNLTDKTAGICSYYVVHADASGVTAAAFSAPAPSCFSATWLSDTPEYPVTLGDTQTGVSVGYGSCLASPVHILTINFFSQGMTGECCDYLILPHPDGTSGEIEAVDCAENLLFASGGRAVINANAGCPCGYAAEASTWGKVKTLYKH